MLRKKNRSLRKGRVEEASALARRIANEITRRTKTQLSLLHEHVDSREMWACVRRLTGKQHNVGCVDGITAESLNDHYCTISTDSQYIAPAVKQTVQAYGTEYITEWQVFKILDKLRPTATGLDNLPAWFLRLGAPIFCSPLSRLFNLSLSTSIVPHQSVQTGLDLTSSQSHSSYSALPTFGRYQSLRSLQESWRKLWSASSSILPSRNRLHLLLFIISLPSGLLVQPQPLSSRSFTKSHTCFLLTHTLL